MSFDDKTQLYRESHWTGKSFHQRSYGESKWFVGDHEQGTWTEGIFYLHTKSTLPKGSSHFQTSVPQDDSCRGAWWTWDYRCLPTRAKEGFPVEQARPGSMENGDYRPPHSPSWWPWKSPREKHTKTCPSREGKGGCGRDLEERRHRLSRGRNAFVGKGGSLSWKIKSKFPRAKKGSNATLTWEKEMNTTTHCSIIRGKV